MEGVTELRLHSAANHVISPGKPLSLKQKDTGGGHTPFVFPNLRAFTIDRVDFGEDFPVSRGKHRERDAGVVTKLQACFAQRAQEGAEIHTLRILGARKLWEEDLERLREVVPCVESDGMLGR
ncbi:hypothetical protein FOMPIDRAFT_162539 [Fomitopsis schrenkii]|uniref:Uncharacterized protein n=1 Tax=Fomitopsis schrenkii TaxID=2126942 RepID=S8ETL3_FOMSC|nr:hypothetical protein FOMPIDRAFT_162539 [Fomitopsis schrenkii]